MVIGLQEVTTPLPNPYVTFIFNLFGEFKENQDPPQFSGIFHSVEMFVPMNIPQHTRDGSLTVLFQISTERNSLGIPLEKCLDGSGHHLKDPEEIMFPTIDRTQVQILKLIIAVRFHAVYQLRSLSSIPVAGVRCGGVSY